MIIVASPRYLSHSAVPECCCLRNDGVANLPYLSSKLVAEKEGPQIDRIVDTGELVIRPDDGFPETQLPLKIVIQQRGPGGRFLPEVKRSHRLYIDNRPAGPQYPPRLLRDGVELRAPLRDRHRKKPAGRPIPR